MTLFVLAPFLRLYRFIHPPIPARECAVCCSELSDEEAAVTLDCHGRDMHLHCLRQWTRTKNDCPICRGALPLNIWEGGFASPSNTAGGTNNVGDALGRLSGRGSDHGVDARVRRLFLPLGALLLLFVFLRFSPANVDDALPAETTEIDGFAHLERLLKLKSLAMDDLERLLKLKSFAMDAQDDDLLADLSRSIKTLRSQLFPPHSA